MTSTSICLRVRAKSITKRSLGAGTTQCRSSAWQTYTCKSTWKLESSTAASFDSFGSAGQRQRSELEKERNFSRALSSNGTTLTSLESTSSVSAADMEATESGPSTRISVIVLPLFPRSASNHLPRLLRPFFRSFYTLIPLFLHSSSALPTISPKSSSAFPPLFFQYSFTYSSALPPLLMHSSSTLLSLCFHSSYALLTL